MELIQNKKANVNYLSKIVNITTFRVHPNAEKLKCCTIDGFNIITGIDSEPGLYIYFPGLSQINNDFLSYANLYRHKELNKDPEQSGMFEDNGRVKTIKLRGELSEGFIIPIAILQNYILSVTNQELDKIEEGIEFNAVEHDGKEFWISKKYIPKCTYRNGPDIRRKQSKKVPKGLNKVIDAQFRFHYNTVLLKKCPYVLNPESLIQISSKIHGTSGISAYVLCKRERTFKEKILNFLRIDRTEKTQYDYLYSSRTVIKNKYYNVNADDSYSDIDVWAEADKLVRPHLERGQTAYYEIVGFLPNGGYIQKNYDYGCVAPTDNETYTPEKHFKVRIYRITYTNVDGKVLEYSTRQVRQWCEKNGLIPVEEYYYGKAKDLYPDIDPANHWNETFLDRLSNEVCFNMEQNSPDCKNKVPHEGLVIKIEDGISRAFKLKCFRFINKIDMSEEPNIEDEA